jgi:6-pyruvoyltetrahydropterin/6-carboxytetrahydropterin synthase
MAKIRVTRKFNFEMAHVLMNYDGACRNIHGHSYKLHITLIGIPEEDVLSPKLGMVIDFGDLKEIVQRNVIDLFDHSLVINDKAPAELLSTIGNMFEKYQIVPYQPTCENLLIDFANRLKLCLPKGCCLYKIKLEETATSYAEWFADDNL